jgi:hypothetical protein
MVGPEPIEVTSDGTVWAVWRDDQEGVVFGHLGADGPTVVGEWPFDGGYLRVSDRGEAWALDHVGWGFFGVHRFVDGAWREEEGNEWGAFDRADADVGVDGTFWGIRDGHYGDPIGDDLLIRFDGTEWMTFEPPDWVPTDLMEWRLVEDEWVSVTRADWRAAANEGEAGNELLLPNSLTSFRAYSWGGFSVAPDGSLWVPARLGVRGAFNPWGDRAQSVCDHGIDGVVRFDGETWSRFLQGYCIQSMDIAADGSVWLLAHESGARFPFIQTYVVTRESTE